MDSLKFGYFVLKWKRCNGRADFQSLSGDHWEHFEIKFDKHCDYGQCNDQINAREKGISPNLWGLHNLYWFDLHSLNSTKLVELFSPDSSESTPKKG